MNFKLVRFIIVIIYTISYLHISLVIHFYFLKFRIVSSTEMKRTLSVPFQYKLRGKSSTIKRVHMNRYQKEKKLHRLALLNYFLHIINNRKTSSVCLFVFSSLLYEHSLVDLRDSIRDVLMSFSREAEKSVLGERKVPRGDLLSSILGESARNSQQVMSHYQKGLFPLSITFQRYSVSICVIFWYDGTFK